MNFNKKDFEKCFKKAGVNDEVISEIVNITYDENNNEKQDNVNYCFAVIQKCNETLNFDILAETMFHRACCKGGFRLENSKNVAKEYSGKTLEEKLKALGEQKWMGRPHLTENGEIYTGHCAGSGSKDDLKCSCWRFNGCIPTKGKMHKNYCLCCAGHFRFHYQKALGVKLRVKEIVSSVFDETPQYCSFLFEIIQEDNRKK
jgi:hypothetical protein